MGLLIFGTIWTVLTGYLWVFAMDGATPLERSVFTFFPLAGMFFVWTGWKHMRRWRSLRTETVDGTTVYLWIELNGDTMRSTCDPRPEWEAADADGDGDGGGGD